jgi:ubiquinone/menaquinone biosynthesis C-methylase UbiE
MRHCEPLNPKLDFLMKTNQAHSQRNRVCPVEISGSLDLKIRKWLQNPGKIIKPFIKEGMTVLDIGCGVGFFSTVIAEMVGPGGKVIASDLQAGMLEKLKVKIRGTDIENRIELHQNQQVTIGVSEPVDFILAFYMVHEVPNPAAFFRELKSILKKDGRILVVEPKLFHVSQKAFQQTMDVAQESGLKWIDSGKLFMSWSAVLKHDG